MSMETAFVEDWAQSVPKARRLSTSDSPHSCLLTQLNQIAQQVKLAIITQLCGGSYGPIDWMGIISQMKRLSPYFVVDKNTSEHFQIISLNKTYDLNHRSASVDLNMQFEYWTYDEVRGDNYSTTAPICVIHFEYDDFQYTFVSDPYCYDLVAKHPNIYLTMGPNYYKFTPDSVRFESNKSDIEFDMVSANLIYAMDYRSARVIQQFKKILTKNPHCTVKNFTYKFTYRFECGLLIELRTDHGLAYLRVIINQLTISLKYSVASLSEPTNITYDVVLCHSTYDCATAPKKIIHFFTQNLSLIQLQLNAEVLDLPLPPVESATVKTGGSVSRLYHRKKDLNIFYDGDIVRIGAGTKKSFHDLYQIDPKLLSAENIRKIITNRQLPLERVPYPHVRIESSSSNEESDDDLDIQQPLPPITCACRPYDLYSSDEDDYEPSRINLDHLRSNCKYSAMPPIYYLGNTTNNEINIEERSGTNKHANNSTTFAFKSNGHLERINHIDNAGRVIVKDKMNQIDGFYGYKAARTACGKTCIVKLLIPKLATVIKSVDKVKADGYVFDKYRTNIAIPISIDEVFYIQTGKPGTHDNFFYAKHLVPEECPICLDKISDKITVPCNHKICSDCHKKVSNTCWICKQHITHMRDLPQNVLSPGHNPVDHHIAYSCVHVDGFEYKLYEKITITDFDNDKSHGCGSGIHFCSNPQQVFVYFEFLNIPDESLFDLAKAFFTNPPPVYTNDIPWPYEQLPISTKNIPVPTKSFDKVAVPKKKMPKEQVPTEQVPKKQVLKEQVPKEKMPKEQVPKKQVPKKQVPTEQVPKKQVPTEQVSKKQVPKEKMPKGHVSKKTIPKEQVSVDQISKDELPKSVVPSAPIPPLPSVPADWRQTIRLININSCRLVESEPLTDIELEPIQPLVPSPPPRRPRKIRSRIPDQSVFDQLMASAPSVRPDADQLMAQAPSVPTNSIIVSDQLQTAILDS